MKFSIGYRPATGAIPSAAAIVSRHDCIDEVYFPWVQLPSGRAPLAATHRDRLKEDLTELRRLGVKLNLLLNASCWGEQGFTRTLAAQLVGVIEGLAQQGLIDSVTACSPMIARLVKRDFPELAVRASVNMKLGQITALEQVADLFDGFTVAREYNHDLEHLADLHRWCDREGKHMQLLANSGCLPHCAVQMFHDNLVAHEGREDNDVAADRFADHIPGGCWERLSEPARQYRFLAGTWIRPEDVHHYESITPRLKLATRMHSRPAMVVRAYARGHFSGNLPDLLEPSHSRLFAPRVIDNSRFPDNWFETITTLNSPEAADAYYHSIFRDVLIDTTATDNLATSPLDESHGHD